MNHHLTLTVFNETPLAIEKYGGTFVEQSKKVLLNKSAAC